MGRRPVELTRGRWAVWAAAALLVGVGARGWLAEPLRVTSGSMSPTLERGDAVVVEKLGRPGRGDLVVFHSPEDGELTLKRVVGLPGDTVEMRDARLVVNGRHVREPAVDHGSIDGTYFGPVSVPADALFVLGDRRARSVDSRTYGAVELDRVVGRVVVRVWPPLRPR